MGELLQRAANNPILTAADLPYPANPIANPGAAQVGEETFLLPRLEDLRRVSHGLGGAGQATTRETRPARRLGERGVGTTRRADGRQLRRCWFRVGSNPGHPAGRPKATSK